MVTWGERGQECFVFVEALRNLRTTITIGSGELDRVLGSGAGGKLWQHLAPIVFLISGSGGMGAVELTIITDLILSDRHQCTPYSRPGPPISRCVIGPERVEKGPEQLEILAAATRSGGSHLHRCHGVMSPQLDAASTAIDYSKPSITPSIELSLMLLIAASEASHS